MQNKVEMPSGRAYKNIARIQSVIADAEMMLGAARSYVFSAMAREWARLEKMNSLRFTSALMPGCRAPRIRQSARVHLECFPTAVDGS